MTKALKQPMAWRSITTMKFRGKAPIYAYKKGILESWKSKDSKKEDEN